MTNDEGRRMNVGHWSSVIRRYFYRRMMSESPVEHQAVYQDHAATYDLLVAREDYEGNIPRVLREVADWHGRTVVELGAGTGRLTRLVAPWVKSLYAFDLSPAMLAVAAASLTRETGWLTAAADHRALPLPDRSVDMVLAGWTICYLVSWHPRCWQPELARALAEMERVLRPGGQIILLETMGTGYETPHPPEQLQPYYDYLQTAGFHSQWFRTDYQFPSAEEARRLTTFFFGPELAAQFDGRIYLPECTGVFSRFV
jgi:ubiquinone/menaquinone biosynthesis C-methylase UbiE